MKLGELALLPRDGFFFKDGRGWTQTGDAGRTAGLPWPFPPTLRGALRTAYGFHRLAAGAAWGPNDWVRETGSLTLGPSLPIRRVPGQPWAVEHRLWPAPADALALEGQPKLLRLDPVPVPDGQGTLGRDEDKARERLWWPRLEGRDKPVPAAPWWRDHEFTAWLCGRPLSVPGQLRQPVRFEVHLAIAPGTQVAEDAALFTTTRSESLDRVRDSAEAGWREWALALSAELPDDWLPGVVPLGADRRPAAVECLGGDFFAPPAGLEQAWAQGASGLRLVCLTPGDFGGWCLPDFVGAGGGFYRGKLPGVDGELQLRAALVPRARCLSGWDMAAQHPKPTRRLAPAGAVYFLTKSDGTKFAWPEAKTLWMSALGAGIEEGLGRVVPAIWEPRGRS